MKKLYKITINSYSKAGEVIDSKSTQVAGVDVTQAVRKLKYNLTKQGKKLAKNECVDEVINLGVIQVK